MSEVINAKRLIGKLLVLQEKVVPAATAQAVNRVAGTVKTRTVRAVSKQMGTKQATVRRRVVVSKKATAIDPSAELRIKGKPLNLIEFGARTLKKGTVTAKPWGRRQRFSSAFIATMPSGSTIVVKRSVAGRAGKKISAGRWAGKSPHIEAVFGPGIAKEASTKTMRTIRRRTVNERMPIEMERAFRYKVTKLLIK